MENYKAVTGIAIDRSNAIICVNHLNGRGDAVPQILEVIALHNIQVDLINQNLQTSDSISFTVPQADVAKAIRLLETLSTKFPAIEVSFDPDATKVSVVGSGIAASVAIAARTFGALGSAGVNVKLAATSDRRLTIVVSGEQADLAAQSLHRAFELDQVANAAQPRLQKTS